MTLQSSGPISIANIVTEKGGTPSAGGNYSLASLSSTNINSESELKPDLDVPHAISEFYGYDHGALPPVYNAFEIRFDASSAQGACIDGNAGYLYSLAESLANGVVVYSASNGTGTPTNGWYSDGVNTWQSTSGTLGSETECLPVYNPFNVFFSSVDAVTACNSGTPITVYAAHPFLDNGVAIWTNDDGTGTPTNGWYSEDGFVWQSTSGALSGQAVCEGLTYYEFLLTYDASDAQDACNSGTPVTVYSLDSILDNGIVIWNNDDGTGTPTNGWYSDGEAAWQSTSGTLGSQTACEEPPPTYYDFELFYDASDAQEACTGTPVTVYSTSVSLANSSVIWNNNNGTGTPSNGFYSDGVNTWQSTSGTIGSQAECEEPPPTYYDFELLYDASDAQDACNTGTPVTVYSLDVVLVNGSVIWNNNNGTGTPTNGFYSDGTDAWQSTSGTLGSEVACEEPPPTYYDFELFYDASDAQDACTGTPVTVYSLDVALANASVIWNNNNGTGTPTNGFYSDGTDVWQSTSGTLGSEAACEGPPPITGPFNIGTTSFSQSSFADACPPNVFDVIEEVWIQDGVYYTNETATTPLNGGNKWWGEFPQGSEYTVIRIDEDGVGSDPNECT
jgi:hypothetical protein